MKKYFFTCCTVTLLVSIGASATHTVPVLNNFKSITLYDTTPKSHSMDTSNHWKNDKQSHSKNKKTDTSNHQMHNMDSTMNPPR